MNPEATPPSQAESQLFSRATSQDPQDLLLINQILDENNSKTLKLLVDCVLDQPWPLPDQDRAFYKKHGANIIQLIRNAQKEKIS